MMRPDPGTPPAVPDASQQPAPGMIRQVRRYQLITPLFGGGAQTQAADAVTIVRGSEVRGHLRFWWRATRGGQFGGDLQRMKAAEDALWGAPATKTGQGPSEVILALTVINRGQRFVPRDEAGNVVRDRDGKEVPIGHFRSPYSYVAFPLQQNPDPKVLEAVEFDLTMQFPIAKQAEVEAALWAWETFGGIGGRTRRGFGALCCTRLDGTPVPPPACTTVAETVRDQLRTHVIAVDFPAGVPHLLPTSQLRTTDKLPDANAAWLRLIRRLKEFRQDRDVGRSPNHPGRSRWPEPDAIRRRFPSRTFVHPARHPVDKFPRAAFGLPIVFHFKDSGDPQETRLQGSGAGRLASPLILRPVRCSNGAVGLGLILEGTGTRNIPGGLELHGAPVPSAPDQLNANEARQIPKLAGQPDVLLAFLNTL